MTFLSLLPLRLVLTLDQQSPMGQPRVFANPQTRPSISSVAIFAKNLISQHQGVSVSPSICPTLKVEISPQPFPLLFHTLKLTPTHYRALGSESCLFISAYLFFSHSPWICANLSPSRSIQPSIPAPLTIPFGRSLLSIPVFHHLSI